MLMDFLLSDEQAGCGKPGSQRRTTVCFPANIDIVVEEPLEEAKQKQIQVEAEAEEELVVEIDVDKPRGTSSSDPELEKSVEDAEEDRKGVGGDEGGGLEEGERKEDREMTKEDDKGDKEEEGEEDKEQGGEKKEKENEAEVKAEEVQHVAVDLDAFMNEMGLLGERS